MAIPMNTQKAAGPFVMTRAGFQGARLVDVVDEGLKEEEWQGVTKLKPKVSLHFLTNDLIPAVWTHPHTGETINVQETRPWDVGSPFGISRWFTNTSDERGSLRQFLSAWRGRDLTDAEADNFDLESLIGVPAGLNVVHRQTQDGSKWYARIHSAVVLPPEFTAPEIPADYVRIKDREPKDGNASPKSEPKPIQAKPNEVGYGPDYDFTDEPVPSEEYGEDSLLPF